MVDRPIPRDRRAEEPLTDLLDVIERLAANPPSRSTDVGSILGIALSHAALLSNDFYSVFEAEPESHHYARVEWRTPASPRATGGKRLLLWLPSEGCIDGTSVIARFGADIADLRVPTPAGVEGVRGTSRGENVAYYVYRRSWGTLSFGIRRVPPECLRTIVLELQPDAG